MSNENKAKKDITKAVSSGVAAVSAIKAQDLLDKKLYDKKLSNLITKMMDKNKVKEDFVFNGIDILPNKLKHKLDTAVHVGYRKIGKPVIKMYTTPQEFSILHEFGHVEDIRNRMRRMGVEGLANRSKRIERMGIGSSLLLSPLLFNKVRQTIKDKANNKYVDKAMDIADKHSGAIAITPAILANAAPEVRANKYAIKNMQQLYGLKGKLKGISHSALQVGGGYLIPALALGYATQALVRGGENLVKNNRSNIEKQASDENKVNKDGKIPAIEKALSCPIAREVATMMATSHEYKTPNVDGALALVKNYKWEKSTEKLSNLQGIDKPVKKDKVLDIALGIKNNKNKVKPFIVVNQLHGIRPQTPGKKILLDGHHRKEACEFLGLEEVPVYKGTYTGGAEKPKKELREIDKKAYYKEEIYKRAGVEYGFTVYKDKDGKIFKAMKNYTDSKKQGNQDEIVNSFLTYKKRGVPDNQINKKVSNKAIAKAKTFHLNPNEIENILKKSKDFKMTKPDGYSDDGGIVTGRLGAQSVSEYIDNKIKEIRNKRKITQSEIDKITNKIEQLNDTKSKLKWYNFIKRYRIKNNIKDSSEKLQQLSKKNT